jgi:hypothetical protein
LKGDIDMVKKHVKYKDYNGNEREEDFYFNLNKAEAAEMSLSTEGGYEEKIKSIIASQDGAEIITHFKELIVKSYGVKSLDGKYFEKTEEATRKFISTEAYSQIFMELATDATKAAEFVNGIMDFADKSKKAEAGNTIENNTSGLALVK